MSNPRLHTRLALISLRRSAAAALIALQLLISAWPAMERRSEVRLDTHAEEQGNRHLFAHDETTCTVCNTVRTLVADAPVARETLLPLATRSRVETLVAPLAPSFEFASDNPSRAPPVLH